MESPNEEARPKETEDDESRRPGVDEIVASERAISGEAEVDLAEVLREMGRTYRADPVVAVRGQAFIQHLHRYIKSQLEVRLTRFAGRRGIEVVLEPTVLGSHKPKDIDVAVIDPQSGPLVLIGVRSQMSSVGKNVLTYYEGIVGECTSLQERFPMSTHAYIYLHPLRSIKGGKEHESIDHFRYARMYAAVTGRDGPMYKQLRGIFDEFAYMVVDFETNPPALRDDIVKTAVPMMDLSVATIVDRVVGRFNSRTLFWEIFK
jgi:hypothetical protein